MTVDFGNDRRVAISESDVKTVPVSAFRRRLSQLLADVAAGDALLITRRDKPVAWLLPIAKRQTSSPERDKAIKRMLTAMSRDVPLGGLRFKRDELYDR